MLTPALLLALHTQVPVIFWPVLWYELSKIRGAIEAANTRGHDGIELVCDGYGRLHLLITPLPETDAEAQHRLRRAIHSVFPASTMPVLAGPLKTGSLSSPKTAYSDRDLRLMGVALRGEDWWLLRAQPWYAFAVTAFAPSWCEKPP